MSKEHYDEIMERHVKTLAQNMKAHAAESHRMRDEAIKLILKQAEKRMNADELKDDAFNLLIAKLEAGCKP